jgi:uncharacterized membrane protein
LIKLFPGKSPLGFEIVDKYCRVRQSTDGSIVRSMRFACWILKNSPPHLTYVIPKAFSRQSSYANAPQIYVIGELPLLFCVSVFRVLYFAFSCVFLLKTLSESLIDVSFIARQNRQLSCSHDEQCSMYFLPFNYESYFVKLVNHSSLYTIYYFYNKMLLRWMSYFIIL